MPSKRPSLADFGKIVAFVVALACGTDKSIAPTSQWTFAPHRDAFPRPRDDCYVYAQGFAGNIYPGLWASWLDPTITAACGTSISIEARPDSGADNRDVWYRMMDLDQDGLFYEANYWTSGTYYIGNTEDAPVIFRFTPSVKGVRTDWTEALLPGNTIIAFDSLDHELARHSIPAAVAGVVRTDVITMRGIRTIKLVPAAGNTASGPGRMLVEMWIVPDTNCAPTGDATLDSAVVRSAMFNMLDAVLADPNRTERAIEVYRTTDPSLPPVLQVRQSPLIAGGVAATECSAPIATLVQAGYSLVMTAHVHGKVPPETFSTCPDFRPGQKVAAGPSGCTSGRVACDFKVADATGKPVYVIDRYNVYRILPNATNRRTGSYDHKWKTNRQTGCIVS